MQIKAGKTMQQLFPDDAPRAVFPECEIALATQQRLGRDVNGRTLHAEACSLLDRAGVEDDMVREFWLDLWAAADGEFALVQAEEMAAMREG